MAGRFIALDLCADSIRMAVVARDASGQVEFLDTGFAFLDFGASPEMPREAVLAMALKRLLDEKKPAVRKAVISIEGPSVFSRLVRLPPVSPDKIQQTIRHEAVQNIPFPLDEVVWDAHVFNPEDPEPDVLLVAVKSELINGLVCAVSASGLLVLHVTVAPVGLANAVRSVYGTEESLLLVDAGTESTTLVSTDGSRIFFRTFPIAGSQESRLMQEIERSISFYTSKLGGDAPVRILSTGEDAICPEILTDRLERPAEIFDPLKSFGVSAGRLDKNISPVLVGLAVEHSLPINLIPDALKRERCWRRSRPIWLASAATLVLIAGVWLFGLNRMLMLSRVESERVTTQIQMLSRVEAQLLPVEERMAKLSRNADAYREAVGRRLFWLKNLQEIDRHLPPGMFLSSSEPIKKGNVLVGFRVAVVSYLDKETEGVDSVKIVRNALRSSERFCDETKISSRPSKNKFARKFVLDLYFEEGKR